MQAFCETDLIVDGPLGGGPVLEFDYISGHAENIMSISKYTRSARLQFACGVDQAVAAQDDQMRRRAADSRSSRRSASMILSHARACASWALRFSEQAARSALSSAIVRVTFNDSIGVIYYLRP